MYAKIAIKMCVQYVYFERSVSVISALLLTGITITGQYGNLDRDSQWFQGIFLSPDHFLLSDLQHKSAHYDVIVL